MTVDPFMPSRQRLPMNPVTVVINGEPASPARPFALRGLRPRGSGIEGQVINLRHRTPVTQRLIPAKTNMDNKEVDDSYTVPDD